MRTSTRLAVIATIAAAAVLSLTACGDSGPVRMDAQTEAEYQAAKKDLKTLSEQTMRMSLYANAVLRRARELGGVFETDRNLLEQVAPELEGVKASAKKLTAFMGAAQLAYHIPDTEFRVARDCFSTIGAFQPIVTVLLNDGLPSDAQVQTFKSASKKLRDSAEELGYQVE